MTLLRRLTVSFVLGLAALPAGAETFITVASTTSTENSGLFGHILPLFKEKTGVEVRVIAQGTGQALETARRGDADVVLVHARAQEEKFVAEGWGVQRFDVMYNDFILVGPSDDPAKTKAAATAAEAFKAVAALGAKFASRGDDSGTHVAEKKLWEAAGIAAEGQPWYLSTGSGMGATLNTAAQVPAYALADRGTWLSFENRGPLEITFEGDEVLFNPYGVILVNKEKHPHVKVEEGQAFVDWLISADGQAAIAEYKINGQQLFFPSAAK